MLYTDFIRKKMHNLAKIITVSGYPLKIISKFNRKAVDYAIHGATSPGKNLIPYPYYDTSGKTHNGITYTVAPDGGITLDGTADNISAYFILPTWSNSSNITPPKGKYTLSGLTDGSVDTYYMEFSAHKITGSSAATVLLKRCYTEPVAVDLTDLDYDFIGLSIKVKTGVSIDSLTVYPMLNDGETAEEYEPYTEYGVGDKTKNLIPYPYSNPNETVSNGITYTVNPDGSITLNGTCTETWSQFFIKSGSNTTYTLPPGKYTISGCAGQTESSCYLEFVPYKNGSAVSGRFIRQSNEPITFDFTDEDYETYNLKIAVRGIGTSFDNFTIYPMINEGETAEEYEPYSEYDYRITLKNTGKNLIPYPYAGFEGEKEVTINGITFTDNGDGSIGVDGTATADAHFTFTGDFVLPGGVDLTISINHDNQDFYIMPGEREGNPNEDGNYVVYCDLIVYSGVTINNGICRPQIEFGETATNYEVYRIPELTTIYTNSQIKDGETMSYRADKLPELKLYKGENNITVETEVAPTSVDMRYYD